MRHFLRYQSLRKVNADHLVAVSGLGRTAAFALFKQHYGTTPHAELERRRCRLAAAMLKAGGRIETVARRVGYTRTATFSQAFRRVHGVLPSCFVSG